MAPHGAADGCLCRAVHDSGVCHPPLYTSIGKRIVVGDRGQANRARLLNPRIPGVVGGRNPIVAEIVNLAPSRDHPTIAVEPLRNGDGAAKLF